MSLAVDLPETLRTALEGGNEPVDPYRWALEALVIEAIREGRLTRGEGGEILGLGFHEREALYRRRGVTYDLSDEERAQERADMRLMFNA